MLFMRLSAATAAARSAWEETTHRHGGARAKASHAHAAGARPKTRVPVRGCERTWRCDNALMRPIPAASAAISAAAASAATALTAAADAASRLDAINEPVDNRRAERAGGPPPPPPPRHSAAPAAAAAAAVPSRHVSRRAPAPPPCPPAFSSGGGAPSCQAARAGGRRRGRAHDRTAEAAAAPGGGGAVCRGGAPTPGATAAPGVGSYHGRRPASARRPLVPTTTAAARAAARAPELREPPACTVSGGLHNRWRRTEAARRLKPAPAHTGCRTVRRSPQRRLPARPVCDGPAVGFGPRPALLDRRLRRARSLTDVGEPYTSAHSASTSRHGWRAAGRPARAGTPSGEAPRPPRSRMARRTRRL